MPTHPLLLPDVDATPRHRDVWQRMLQVMGPLPADARRPTPTWRVCDEQRDGSLVRRRIDFAVECDRDGQVSDWCPAWWLEPQAGPGPSAKRAAMLCLHQTVRCGSDEPVGLGGSPRLHYALELARLGFVCLAPDYPLYNGYTTDPYALGYASATMKGLWNHSIAIDVLGALPQVDARRVGCIGHSLGAHNALFLAALDPRVAVTVSSCGFNPFAWNNDEGRGEPGDIRDWSHRGYMPWIAERFGNRAQNMPFDFHDVLAAIAPRPLFVNAPQRDFFIAAGVRETLQRVAELFPPNFLQAVHPDCEHDFPDAVRATAYAFVQRHLR